MWIDFLVECLFLLLLLYIPGLLLGFGLNLTGALLIGLAPLLSAGCIYLISMLFVNLEASASWFVVSGLCVALSILLAIIALLRGRRLSQSLPKKEDLKLVVQYVAIASAVAVFCYVLPLDGANSFLQHYDNYSHLARVADFVSQGQFSEPSFTSYPSLWHSLAAIAADFWGKDVCLAANAVNFVILSVVLPLSIFTYLSQAFNGDSRIVSAAKYLSVSFVAFPWATIVFGPLYPLLIGNSFVLVAGAIVAAFFESRDRSDIIRYSVLFIFCCVVLAVSHPSSIFMGIVLFAPFVIAKSHDALSRKLKSRTFVICIMMLLVCCIMGIWTACFLSSSFRGVVSFNWPAFASKGQAVSNLLMFNLTSNGAPQPLLSVLVFTGVAYCFVAKRFQWLLVSYVLSAFMYFVDITSEGFLKHFLCGFWYSDSFRIAGIVALSSLPLAAIGLSLIVRASDIILSRMISFSIDRVEIRKRMGLVFAAFFLLIVYYPSFQIPRDINVVTGFGSVRKILADGNSLARNYQALDYEEIEFVGRVKSIVGDSPIINYPYDGSLYAYPIVGLNVLDRSWYGYQFEKNSELKSLRTSLCDVTTNNEVRRALDDGQYEYVMLLDYGRMRDYANGQAASGFYYADYIDGSWLGIESITDDTPGFDLILSDGDMRLYRISS